MTKLLVAYSTLIALKNNLPDSYHIEEKYVEQFHVALKQISEEFGEDIFDSHDFEIPEKDVVHRLASANSRTGEKRYTREKFCDRSLLMTKLDASLNYVQLISSAEDKEKIMGFHPES